MHDHADGEAEQFVDGAHPFRVAAGEVIVDGDDVHARPASAFKIGGKRGDERFSFARFHFGDFALVQDDTADQLHVEMAHAEGAAAGFADQREGGNQRGLERPRADAACNSCRRDRRLRGGSATSALSSAVHAPKSASESFFISGSSALMAPTTVADAFDVALVLRADEARDDAINYFFNVHSFRV